jgi:hypothetical protein
VSKYKIGQHTFKSKAGIQAHARSIREKCEGLPRITDPADIDFLTDLIQRHKDAVGKIGAGIDYFFVAPDPEFRGTCFYLMRSDGIDTDFGVPACIKSYWQLNQQSLRRAIRPQIEEYRERRIRESNGTLTSDLSGELLDPTQIHVHHVTSFKNIVERFFASERIDLNTTLLTRSIDCNAEPVFRDPELIAHFLDFHATFPLQIVSQRENLSDCKKTIFPQVS